MSPYEKVACGGMDVHYKFSRVTFRDKQGEVVARERIDHVDREELKRRLSYWPKDVPIVMEASFGWGWLADLMLELDLKPELSNCFKVEKMRQARGWAKSNRKDSDLTSLLPLEPQPWWQVWMAPTDVRDRREWMRYRRDLVIIQTQTKNRIHAIFHRHGIFHDFSDLFGGKGRRFLGEPIACDSGSEDSDRAPLGRHLGHRGNKTLKWAFIEAAHGAVRSGGKWRAMFDRHTDGGKHDCNDGYIKVARHLVKVVYAVWSKQMPYTESPPRAVGRKRRTSRKRRRRSRSGTGLL